MDLEKLIEGLNLYLDERTIVGIGDDAGVYAYGGFYFVHTVDFITPVVNDPYLWGAIATANALSDIYAMGAEPLNALAIVCFNNCELDIGVLREVMRGCAEKLGEARTVLLGGHTVDDREPKFGLAVTGVSTDGNLLMQEGARVGDLIAITKPVGVGIITKGIKERRLKEKDVETAINYMLELNNKACILAKKVGASACTDATGFGLLGHAYNIARKSGVRLAIDFKKVPIYEEAIYLIKEGVFPKGAVENLNFVKTSLIIEGLEEWQLLLLSDPITSGGLLFTFAEERLGDFNKVQEELGIKGWIIGRVEEGEGLRVF